MDQLEPMLETEGVHHIGIAVRDLNQSLHFYISILGARLERIETVHEQMVKVAFLKLANVNLELMEPTEQNGTVARFIERHGEGLHHIALKVTSINERLQELKEAGLPLIDQKARTGLNGSQIGFLHPKGSNRVLLELFEEELGTR